MLINLLGLSRLNLGLFLCEGVRSTTTSYDLGSVNYLPHCVVVRQNRDTTKVSIVFDASGHVDNEPSQNDVLYSGPCMLPLVHDILIRFRIGKIGIVANVQQAFLQIEIDENIGIFYDLFGLTMFYLTTHHMFDYVLQELLSV